MENYRGGDNTGGGQGVFWLRLGRMECQSGAWSQCWGQGASTPIHCLTAINQSNAALADANTASVYSGSPMMWTPFGTRIVFR